MGGLVWLDILALGRRDLEGGSAKRRHATHRVEGCQGLPSASIHKHWHTPHLRRR